MRSRLGFAKLAIFRRCGFVIIDDELEFTIAIF